MVSISEAFFQRTLNQKTGEARDAVQACVLSFLSQAATDRQSTARAAFDAVGRVVDMLHEQDRPKWLSQLHANLKLAHSNHSDVNGVGAMQHVANEYQGALNRHEWRLTDIDATTGFDFDAVYNKYRAENRIPELFEAIISALNDIIESGKVDSVRVLDELRRILATLKKAKNGSYFSTQNSWYFFVTWLKNTGWELLGEIPGYGAAVRGFRKTVEDMDVGITRLNEQVHADLQRQLSQDFPRLIYLDPEISSLEHSQDSPTEILP